ncbi:hypothetical protein F511_10160 [Dorcoceras hygrometricum]|uniref:Uncharacterized protein n=1 Tax=Dorcoceras hygrometricum TaxID=472368 RepID=A0A2Z7DCG3_9LAMI|nr:hypothetical protein F511_10160 [Dorcoceras hygrometricum]
MPQLRHLVVKRGSILPVLEHEEFAKSHSILHNLQTLHVIDLPFTMEVIRRLPSLKKLNLKYESRRHYQANGIKNLVHLHQLEVLNFVLAVLPYDSQHFPLSTEFKKVNFEGNFCGGVDSRKQLFSMPREVVYSSVSLPERDSESIGDAATLQILTIKRCNPGVEESARKIQEQQDNEDLKVHIVPIED